MNAWGITDKGTSRQQNQDSFCIDLNKDEGQAVFVVCDGMGGARAGNVASELAVKVFSESIKSGVKTDMNLPYMTNCIRASVARANSAVFEKASSDKEFSGMGTTLVGALINHNYAVIANIGDSRAYYINPEGILRITKDHSVVEDLISRGDLTHEQARTHPSKNLITRALGTESEVEPDVYNIKIEDDGFLLLCSDGLTNLMSDQEILYEVLHGGKPEDCCDRLINDALKKGAPDNITVVLFQK